MLYEVITGGGALLKMAGKALDAAKILLGDIRGYLKKKMKKAAQGSKK